MVDYKATSKSGEVTLDAEWQVSYKRQVEIYQWLFRQNEFKVSNVAYFVYCNGDASADQFNGCLDFDIKVIPYLGDDSWVSGTISKLMECLKAEQLPPSEASCDFCSYRKAAATVELGKVDASTL